jgi:ATP-binding cassette subfamily G (WHITE) protein 2 (SNQ2)
VPSNAVALAETYRKSETYHRMKAERDEYNERMAADPTNRNDFMAAVAEDKRKGVSAKSPYTVSFPMQVAALTKRQFQLKRQDKFGLYTGYFTSIGESSERERSVEPRLTHPLAALTVIAIISGTVYLQLPQTSAGAFTRGGAIFIAMLFNALNAFSELPTQMMGRPILFKQVNYSYYRPGALAIASNFAELPFVRRSDLVLLAPSCAISPFHALVYRTCPRSSSSGSSRSSGYR